jgi:hypothetical protein
MPAQPRRRYRPRIATWVFLAVIATLVVIVTRGPTKFFAARDVRADAACTMRHCASTPDEAPSPDQIFRKQQP